MIHHISYSLESQEWHGAGQHLFNALAVPTGAILEQYGYPEALELRNDQLPADIPPGQHTFIAEQAGLGVYGIKAALEQTSATDQPRIFNSAEYYFLPNEPIEDKDVIRLGRTFIGLQREPQPRLLKAGAIILGLVGSLHALAQGKALPDDMWLTW